MGASAIASGRRPSMDRITTRRARGAAVGATVGVDVSVAVCVAVTVAVNVGGSVAVSVAVGGVRGDPGRLGIWQANRRINEKKDRNSL